MQKRWRLFRYRPVNEFTWQELELSRLYCASLKELNDVFDCRADWLGSVRRALASSPLEEERRKRLAHMQSMFEGGASIEGVGVCCFSATAEDHLMWAHYADAHRGICLMYEFPEDYLYSRHPSGSDFYVLGGSSVTYGDNAFFSWLTTADLDGPPMGEPMANALTRLLATKAGLWAHEEEFRVLTNRPGFLELQPEFLTQVIFGIETSAVHRELVTRAAKRGNKDVKFAEVKRSGASDFGLDFPDLEI